ARTQCEVVRLFRETHPDLPPLNQATISKIEAQYREMGHVRKVPSKSQAVVDDDTKLNLLLALEENPITPVRQLARDSNLNHKTVLKILKYEKKRPYKMQAVQELLEDDPDRRIVGPFFFDDTLNGARYLRLLQHELMSVLCYLFPNPLNPKLTDERLWFQQDGAPPHYGAIVPYRSSIHETTGQTPASIVMGRELRLPCDLKFGCTPGDDVAGEDYVSTLRQRMDDIHERVRSNIQGASDRMKETYDINANDGRYQPGNQVWLYNPQRRRGLSPKLQSSWEGPYEVVTRINDVVYRIQKLPRGKPRVVHFNRLAPFAGSNDEQAEARVRHVSPPDGELSFEEFMSLHSNGQKARYGVTREEPRDLFQTPADFCLAHCVAADLRMSRGIALTFKKAFGQLEELRRQRPEVGRVLQITAAEQEKERSVFYLVTKQLSHHKPTYQTVWDTLVELRDVLLSQSISSLAIPKIASGLDGLDWRVIRSMLEVLFRFTGIEILVCCYNPRRSLNEKTVDCFFYQTSRCKNGSFCRYRHRPGDDTIRDEMSLRRGQCYERWASPPL
ncbi:hypothetical protein NQ318_022628, partial [Aromia moschata]